ncbi:hypothetical protein LJC15_00265 [Desulfovibrio sp. OttesenSCG-928-G11]|nr:hypothetical protein [Desulfovibrio sp. OttesenSCG-928-G11]
MTSVWTREELRQQIADTKAAISAALSAQSYGIENRNLTRQKLETLREHLSWLQNELSALDGSGRGPVFVTARPRR